MSGSGHYDEMSGSGSGDDDASLLHTTKDIYIEAAVSFSITPVVASEDRTTVPSFTGRPHSANSASDFDRRHMHFVGLIALCFTIYAVYW